jgi:very-short-patch-repair endonuclease
MAAVLACGKDALLSHRSAADLWGLRIAGHRIEVTVPHARPRRQGILVHRTRAIPPADRVLRDSIPITSLGRTLVDLADVVTRARLERAFDDAERLGILNVAEVHPIPGRAGTNAITSLVTERRMVPETKSELERRFAAFIREEGLPWPVFNTLVEGFEVDVLWREQKLIVELDSWEYHRTRKAFEDDRAKEPILRLAGYEVIRVTSHRLTHDRATLLAQITAFLERRA